MCAQSVGCDMLFALPLIVSVVLLARRVLPRVGYKTVEKEVAKFPTELGLV